MEKKRFVTFLSQTGGACKLKRFIFFHNSVGCCNNIENKDIEMHENHIKENENDDEEDEDKDNNGRENERCFVKLL